MKLLCLLSGRQLWLSLLLLSLLMQSCALFRRTPPVVTNRDNQWQENNDLAEKQRKEQAYKDFSARLNLPLNGTENLELLGTAEEWIGVPYKYGGNTREGTDCSGLAGAIYQKVYHKEISRSAAGIYAQCNPLKKEELTEGDFVFFKINSDRIGHVGIYLTGKKFIHASTKKGVMISGLEEEYYKKYFFSGGRLK